jgi:hypothetical protein
MLVGYHRDMFAGICITTGVERSFWPESGVPGG